MASDRGQELDLLIADVRKLTPLFTSASGGDTADLALLAREVFSPDDLSNRKNLEDAYAVRNFTNTRDRFETMLTLVRELSTAAQLFESITHNTFAAYQGKAIKSLPKRLRDIWEFVNRERDNLRLEGLIFAQEARDLVEALPKSADAPAMLAPENRINAAMHFQIAADATQIPLDDARVRVPQNQDTIIATYNKLAAQSLDMARTELAYLGARTEILKDADATTQPDKLRIAREYMIDTNHMALQSGQRAIMALGLDNSLFVNKPS